MILVIIFALAATWLFWGAVWYGHEVIHPTLPNKPLGLCGHDVIGWPGTVFERHTNCTLGKLHMGDHERTEGGNYGYRN